MTTAFKNRFIRGIRLVGLVLMVLFSLVLGFMLRGCLGGTAISPATEETSAPKPERKVQLWTCSMHPQIKLPKPGKCPICFMDLIPLESDSSESGGLRELTISDQSAKLTDIQTTPVMRKFPTAEIRMVGKVDYDETRVSYITAWIAGRLDRLFVDYTGVPVKKGDHMVSLYSPDLLTAQQELLQAIATARELKEGSESIVQQTTAAMIDAAREKLRLWGLTREQVAEIEKRRTAEDHVTIYSPAGGIVVHKNAQEGMYVQTGTRIYTIADLSRVWVNLDAYESDLVWLRYGLPVTFTTEAHPGEAFNGTISFIHPVLDEATRTVKVRVTVDNEDGRLKPGMFVRAVAVPRLATDQRIMNRGLAGKWISPMHPEIVKEGPGECDVCGMPLVRAESLGYVGKEPQESDKPLVIPASAALLTGKRAVVYVEKPNTDVPTFEGREIVLGPRAGDEYVVKRGLAFGERVVTSGNFKLDAELQIKAKPSMMTPSGGGGGGMAGMDHGGELGNGEKAAAAPMEMSLPVVFTKQLSTVVDRYLDIHSALSRDDVVKAAAAAAQGAEALAGVDMELVSGQIHMDWMKARDELAPLLKTLAKERDLETARQTFALLSEALAPVVREFHPTDGKLYWFHCPMAFDNRGANWLQKDDDTRNPYFGSAMFKCGGVEEVIK